MSETGPTPDQSGPKADADKFPSILILKAMEPTETKDERLVSPKIDQSVENYSKFEQPAWDEFMEAKGGSIAERAAATTLAKIYLLKTSQKLSSPEEYRRGRDRSLWAGRFTESSTEIYGAPGLPFVQKIVEGILTELSSGQANYVNNVRSFYERLDAKLQQTEIKEDSELKKLDGEQIAELSNAYKSRTADWLEYLGQHQQDSYSPTDLQECFTQLIAVRTRTDPRWESWTAILEEAKDKVSVIGSKKVVSVGANRLPASYEDMVGLAAHELGIHATRAINGADIHKSLGVGLPGYLDIEESLGVMAEQFVIGAVPDKAKDRYIDSALASGVIPGVQMTRLELIELATTRNLARREIRGQATNESDIEQEVLKAKSHVNRIFRGGDGLPGASQAVFTKDIIYYPAALEDYMARQLESGKSPEEILDFLLQGKFDPTDSSHLKRLEELKRSKH